MYDKILFLIDKFILIDHTFKYIETRLLVISAFRLASWNGAQTIPVLRKFTKREVSSVIKIYYFMYVSRIVRLKTEIPSVSF